MSPCPLLSGSHGIPITYPNSCCVECCLVLLPLLELPILLSGCHFPWFLGHQFICSWIWGCDTSQICLSKYSFTSLMCRTVNACLSKPQIFYFSKATILYFMQKKSLLASWHICCRSTTVPLLAIMVLNIELYLERKRHIFSPKLFSLPLPVHLAAGFYTKSSCLALPLH